MDSVLPGFTNEAFPEVFTTMPTQPTEKKPGQLPEEKIRQFFEQGYVTVPDFFHPDELQPCRDAIEGLVEELAQKLYKAGKISGLHNEHGLFQRLTHIENEFPGANILLHKFGKLPKAFRDLWSNERLLNVVEQLIGPDIAGHPVWNLRTKTPHNDAATVPWHQDSAYLDVSSYNVLQPTAWIPFLDADEINGCMEVAERGHKTGKIARHQCCHGGTWYVMLQEEEMAKTLEVDLQNDIKLCPIPYGGMLLLNNAIPHRSLNNRSDQIRWSIDLRWQRPDQPVGFYGLKQGILMRSSKEPYLAIDWEAFDRVNRHNKQREFCKDVLQIPDDAEFDTTIQGPWMKKWEIVHMNRHTEKLSSEKATSWHKS